MKSQLQKGAELWRDKVLTSKKQFFSPKSVMHGPKFSTPPKGNTPNDEEHCVQIWSPNSKKWLSYGVTTVWLKKKKRRKEEKKTFKSNTLSVENGEANKDISNWA